MNAFKAFGDNDLNTRQTNAFGCPVSGGTLAIICTSNNDQGLLALHICFYGFPHSDDLIIGFNPSQRALLNLAFNKRHFINEFWICESRTLSREMIASMGGIGVEVFLGQSHF